MRLALFILLSCIICLTGCGYSTTQTKFVTCEIPQPPERPTYERPVWSDLEGLYCLDTQNARLLLLNAELCQAWGEDERLILEGLRASCGGLNPPPKEPPK